MDKRRRMNVLAKHGNGKKVDEPDRKKQLQGKGHFINKLKYSTNYSLEAESYTQYNTISIS